MTLRANRQRVAEHAAVATPDPEIMRRLAGGDLSALGELYDRYQTSLQSFVARVTRDAEDVDDLVHATFLAAAKSAARYDGRVSCRPWLVGIAAHLIRRRRQKFGRFFAMLATLRGTSVSSRDPRLALQARTDIDRALRRITDEKRIALLLAEVEGLSCDEIATALGVPIGTVWTRLHAARRELREILGAEEGS